MMDLRTALVVFLTVGCAHDNGSSRRVEQVPAPPGTETIALEVPQVSATELPDMILPPITEEWIGDDLVTDDDPLFRNDLVHSIAFRLTDDDYNALSFDPDEYVPAQLEIDGQRFRVEMRLKGSSTFEPISGKPSIKVRVDQLVRGRRSTATRASTSTTAAPTRASSASAWATRSCGPPACPPAAPASRW